MKKTLYSLIVLSTMTLSYSAISAEFPLQGKEIQVTGSVINVNHCDIEAPAAIVLDPVNTGQFDPVTRLSTIEPRNIEINFSNCTNNLKHAKVHINAQDQSYIANIAPEDERSSAAIAVLNYSGNVVDLSLGQTLTANINKDNRTANISIPVNYYNPNLDQAVTAGQVQAPITLNISVDDIQIDG